LAIIPFGPDIHFDHLGQVAYHDYMPESAERVIRLQMLQIDFGILFYFAILTIANYGSTIAGWASYNKWALLGGLRASSQMMSYEISMGLSLMGVFLFMGTLEPGTMVDIQGGDKEIWYSNPLSWGIFGGGYLLNGTGGFPMLFVGLSAFVLFFTAAIAETKRAPFDLPEGEPEIIGYFVEYSGMRWGMFFLRRRLSLRRFLRRYAPLGGGHHPVRHLRRQSDRPVLPAVGDSMDRSSLPPRSADEPGVETPFARLAHHSHGGGVFRPLRSGWICPPLRAADFS
jgi:NADH:ubiquinone oxidoreductase subunit H